MAEPLLRACPFCGGAAKRDPNCDAVDCTECGVSHSSVDAWNRRSSPLMGEVAVVDLLRREIRAAGSQAEFARAKGLSRQQVNDVESIRRPVTRAVLDALDLVEVKRYATRRTLPRKEVAHAG